MNEKPSILIVDDLVANLNLLKDILHGDGFKVRPATSGRLALEAARHTPPDLVLLDVNMPEMNGYEVCKAFKNDPNLAEIPILFISALGEMDDKIRAFNEGGQDYITKPFQVEEVLARVRTHLELRRARQELIERNANLETALDNLRKAQSHLVISEKMAALGIMSAGVAHEINNPINFVKTSVHGLQKDMQELMSLVDFCQGRMSAHSLGELTEFKRGIDYETLVAEIPHLFASILQGLERTADIVRSLRAFARTDDALSQRVDLSEVMDSVLLMLRGRLSDRTRIVKHYGKSTQVAGNIGKLSQVLVNLMVNALDAIECRPEGGGEISIRTSCERRDDIVFALLSITDNGPGIAEEHLPRIFDPFFTTKPVGQGVGLGLYICSTIIAEHKGHIEVASQTGAGTTFSIFLPANEGTPC